MNEKLINAEEMGELLSLPPASVRRLAREGKLPCYRLGRLLRFDPAQILEEALRKAAQDERESRR